MEVAAVDSPAQSDAPADTAVAGDTDVAVQPSDEAQPEQAQIALQANGAGATAPAASAEDGVSLDLEAEFRKLERLFEQSKGQDLEQQPLEELLKGYTELQKNY